MIGEIVFQSSINNQPSTIQCLIRVRQLEQWYHAF